MDRDEINNQINYINLKNLIKYLIGLSNLNSIKILI